MSAPSVDPVSIRIRQVDGSFSPEGRRTWAELFDGMPCASAYISTEWVSCWLEEYASALHPVQLETVTGSGRVNGTCLLTVRRTRRGPFTLIRVHINTDGEDPGDGVVVEHNRLLASPGAEAIVYTALSRHLEASPVDQVLLSGADEGHVALLRRALPHWSAEVEWRESPFVDLNKLRVAGHDHWVCLSRNTRSQLRRALRKYHSRGSLRLERAMSPVDGVAMFRDLVALHQAHWTSRGLKGAFATAHRRSFHERFVENGVASGHAHMLRLWCGDEKIGVLYNVVANGHVAYYQSGFRYEADGQLKPGLVAHHLAIEHYLSEGYREYDFLPSGPGEGRYKVSLANETRRLGNITLTRPGWRGHCLTALRALRRLSRQFQAKS